MPDARSEQQSEEATIDAEGNGRRSFKIISRREWGAKPAESVTPWNPNDLFGVTVHWFGIPAAAPRHELCDDLVRSVQRAHQGGEFNDIAYNHLFCPHGFAYEGRGFDRQTGANGTTSANRHYAAVCYMGGRHGGKRTSDRELIEEVEALAKMNACACEATSLALSRGLVTERADAFPEVAQDVGAWLISQWFKRGTDRVVVPHRKWTGSECPGPSIHDWVVRGKWREDLPVVDRVRFELWDDSGKIDQSDPVPVADEEARLAKFLDRVDATALQRLREEGNLGSVQIRRRVIA
jgi:hypothetical protein